MLRTTTAALAAFLSGCAGDPARNGRAAAAADPAFSSATAAAEAAPVTDSTRTAPAVDGHTRSDAHVSPP